METLANDTEMAYRPETGSKAEMAVGVSRAAPVGAGKLKRRSRISRRNSANQLKQNSQ